jgi:UDP-N-acetylglucosamine 2-epimerase (non-hydrolysing)
MKLKIFLVAGARPNFMKIAPLYFEMKKYPSAFEPVLVHTGQHYDENMSKVFFDDLEMPRPDIYLGVGSGTHAAQTAEIMTRFEPAVMQHRPHMVLVVGDVNSTIACALTAIKTRTPSESLHRLGEQLERFFEKRKPEFEHGNVETGRRDGTVQTKKRVRSKEVPILAHVEAGERSYDFSMPEEINRVSTDVLSDLLFTTSSDSDENLLSEGIDPRAIFRVGNIMIDSLNRFLPKAGHSKILSEINRSQPAHVAEIRPENFALATLHRAGNVDNPSTLKSILAALIRVAETVPVIFPMHPRTRKLLRDLGADFLQKLENSRLLIIEPLGYIDFLHLQTQAKLVLTDSGGVQVETSYIGIPCLTLRTKTEWEITLRLGTNRLVSPNESDIVKAAQTALTNDQRRPAQIPQWDGRTAERIVDIFADIFELKLK